MCLAGLAKTRILSRDQRKSSKRPQNGAVVVGQDYRNDNNPSNNDAILTAGGPRCMARGRLELCMRVVTRTKRCRDTHNGAACRVLLLFDTKLDKWPPTVAVEGGVSAA